MDIGETGPIKAHAVITAGVVLVTITALAMAARVVARWQLKTLGIDDVLILVSWILSLGLCSCAMADTRYGLGSHRGEVSDQNYTQYLKLQVACSITYSWGVPAAKASFAILYLRIFPEGRLMRLVNKILIGFFFAQAIEETCVVLFKCSPIQKSWEFLLEGPCIDLHPLFYVTFVFNMITSLILFIEPIPMTWKLQLPLAKRLGLITMLCLGLLVTSISVIRIVYVTGIDGDDTYEIVEPIIWSQVEICALIICSCIPSLRQVIAKIPGLNSALGLSSGKESKKYHDHSAQNFSIQLRSRKHKEYAKSQKSKVRGRSGPIPFGTTSHAMATPMDGISENDSQEEIFPHTNDQGAITVRTEVERHVEDNAESAKAFTMFTDGLSQHGEEVSRYSTQRSDHVSPNGSRGDINWLRRSRS